MTQAEIDERKYATIREELQGQDPGELHLLLLRWQALAEARTWLVGEVNAGTPTDEIVPKLKRMVSRLEANSRKAAETASMEALPAVLETPAGIGRGVRPP